MASLTLPIFSLPKTRTEHSATILKLSQAFQSQGISINDGNTMASQLISYREQGLTDSQILKNFEQTFLASSKRYAEQQAKIKDVRAKQQPLLDELARAKAQRQALAKKTGDAESRTKQQIRDFNKDKTIMVANPENPRGVLITLQEAEAIRQKLDAKGGLKAQDQFSSMQKANSSIIDSIRNLITTEKITIEVIGLNKSFVQLSNGKLVPRTSFKGTIPQRFLDAEKITVPAKITTPDFAPFGGVTTKGGVKVAVDPTKTATKTTDVSKITPFIGAFLPENVKAQLDFLKSLNPKIDAKIFDPLGDLAKSLNLAFSQGQEVFTNTVNTIQKGIETTFKAPEPAKQTVPNVTKPFDPLGDFITSITSLIPKPTETPALPTEPKPTETPALPTEPKPTEPKAKPNKPTAPEDFTHGDPIPTSELPLIARITKFASENTIKIIIGAFAVSSIVGLSMALSKNQRNEILQRSK